MSNTQLTKFYRIAAPLVQSLHRIARSIWQEISPQSIADPVTLNRTLRIGINARMMVATLLATLAVVALVHKFVLLQIYNHRRFALETNVFSLRAHMILANRGNIYDCNGNILARDLPSYDLLVEPKLLASSIRRRSDYLMPVAMLAEKHLGQKREEVLARCLAITERKFTWKAATDIPAAAAALLLRRNIPELDIITTFADGKAKFDVVIYVDNLRKADISRIAEALHKELGLTIIASRMSIEKAQNKPLSIVLATDVTLKQADLFMADLREVLFEEALQYLIHKEEKNYRAKKNTAKPDREALAQRLQKRRPKENMHLFGLSFIEGRNRFYVNGSKMANLLGYVDRDGDRLFDHKGQHDSSKDPRVGRSGIEWLMDSYLQPVHGRYRNIIERTGRTISDGPLTEREAVDGANVYLTLQEHLQQIVEEEISVMVSEFRPDKTYAMMVEPSTGAIMAFAQFPQFNPNDRSTAGPDNIAFHALVNTYEPGSVMKCFSLSCAIEKRVVTLNSTFFCEQGRWRYGGKILRDVHGYGELTVAQILQKSSNIGTAKVSMEVGEEAMYNGLRQFRFGQPTRIGFYPEIGDPRYFSSEASGTFHPLTAWGKLSITRIPIGQGLNCTALQLLQAGQALANHGVIMQLQLIDRVEYPDGTCIRAVPRAKGTAIYPETAQIMTQALKLVTRKGGTGTRAAAPGYDVAGKTGTAQMWIRDNKELGIKGHYSENENFSSFIGYAPADNPRFVLLVSAENPKGPARTGGAVSAAPFGRIAKRTLEYLQITPTLPDELPGATPIEPGQIVRR